MASSPASLIYPDSTALYNIPEGISPYLLERRRFKTKDEWFSMVDALRTSKTVYVGNLSFFTTEEQIYELFSRVAPVKRVIMGLNSITKTPCGFCFVEYYTHEDAVFCKKLISGTKLDDRIIRADIDEGFKEGRQYGRSRVSGGQVRDDHRTDYDAGRGGWSTRAAAEQKSTFSALESLDATGAAAAGDAASSSSSAEAGDAEGSDERATKRRRLDPDAAGALTAAIAAAGPAETENSAPAPAPPASEPAPSDASAPAAAPAATAATPAATEAPAVAASSSSSSASSSAPSSAPPADGDHAMPPAPDSTPVPPAEGEQKAA